MEHLQSIQHLSIFAKTPEEKSELYCASAIFDIVEAVIYAAGTAADQKAQVDISSSEGQDGIPPLALNWSHVTGFLPLIGGCVTKWIKEIMEFNDFKVQLQVCVGPFMKFLEISHCYIKLFLASHFLVQIVRNSFDLSELYNKICILKQSCAKIAYRMIFHMFGFCPLDFSLKASVLSLVLLLPYQHSTHCPLTRLVCNCQ